MSAVKTETVVKNTNYATLYETAEEWKAQSLALTDQGQWQQGHKVLVAATHLHEAAKSMREAEAIAYSRLYSK